jgi:hypothetical protein
MSKRSYVHEAPSNMKHNLLSLSQHMPFLSSVIKIPTERRITMILLAGGGPFRLRPWKTRVLPPLAYEEAGQERRNRLF